MQTIKLNTSAGNEFSQVAKKALVMAQDKNCTVEFEFNGVVCLVDSTTNLDWLYRDYSNSWTMGWKMIGPKCVEKYTPEVQKEYDEKRAKKDAEQKAREEEYKKKNAAEKQLVSDLVHGVQFQIIPGKEDEYAEYVKNNSKDGYSRGVVDYAEYWAKMMQVEISNGKSVREVADPCQNHLGFLGITGFMYGCAVKALSHFWKHGEDLRKWHNKEYGHEGDGVVNPAVLTISK